MTSRDEEWQRCHDYYYSEHGPCCAGCDHWRSLGVVGECRKSVPVPAVERLSMISFVPSVYRGNLDAGHIVTDRSHVCGEFKDDCNWSQVRYLKWPHRPKWLEKMPPNRTLYASFFISGD